MAGSTPVAVKFVTRQSPRELRRFVHEIGILKSLRHTNIVQVEIYHLLTMQDLRSRYRCYALSVLKQSAYGILAI